MTNNLLFVDLETTGLKPVTSNRILEIGILPVNAELEPLDIGWKTLVDPGLYDFDKMGDVVRQMHTENGLFDDLKNCEVLGWQAATKRAIQYCEQFGERQQMPVCGSSVRFDREYLQEYMPALDNWFHYRIIDVSTLKELWKLWFGTEAPKPPKKAHRVLEDCYASVAELNWYRTRIKGGAQAVEAFQEMAAAISEDVNG